MCHYTIGKLQFHTWLKRHVKRFNRSRFDKRALKKVIKATRFFERYAHHFETSIIKNFIGRNKYIKVKKIKQEEGARKVYLSVPAEHFKNIYRTTKENNIFAEAA